MQPNSKIQIAGHASCTTELGQHLFVFLNHLSGQLCYSNLILMDVRIVFFCNLFPHLELPYVPPKIWAALNPQPCEERIPLGFYRFKSCFAASQGPTGPIRFIRSFLDNQMKHHCGTRSLGFLSFDRCFKARVLRLSEVPTDKHLPSLNVFHASTKACVRCCVNGIFVIDVSQSQTASRTAWGRLRFLKPAQMAYIHSF
jgi:hypothetical protein